MSSPQRVDPTLELTRGGRTERVYELKGTALSIGRDPGQEVCFDDVRVSRHHARVERLPDGTCHLVDLESKRSTQLDGRRLTPFERVRLHDGSRIRIVDYELIFHEHASEEHDGGGGESTVLESLDDLSSSRLARQSPHAAEVLQAVLDINRALGGGRDLDEVLGRALDGLMGVFPGAERGFILTAEPEGTPRLRAFRRRCGPAQPPVLSRTILRQVLEEGKAVLIADTTRAPNSGTRRV